MISDFQVWTLPFLLCFGLCGGLGAATALAYAYRVAAGAPADGVTMRAALKAGCRLTVIRCVPPLLLVSCICLLLIAGLPFALQPSALAALRAAACAVLLVLAIIDARCGLLPDALTLPLMWAGLMSAWAGHGVSLHDAVAAAAVSYVSLWALDAIFRLWRGRCGLGGGDMKLVAALGAWLGWAPLPGMLFAACVAGILFAVAGGGRAAWRSSLAFGPFLALAGGLWLVGDPVVQFFFCPGNGVCTRSA